MLHENPMPPAIMTSNSVWPVKLAVNVYSPLGEGIVPSVPDSEAPGPQNLSRTEAEVWSLSVSEIDDPPDPDDAEIK